MLTRSVRLTQLCVLLTLALHPAVCQAQEASQDTVSGKNPELRLPISAFKQVSPPSLLGQAMTVYKDPRERQDRYYIKPVLMPKWSRFADDLARVCSGSTAESEVLVPISVEFQSETLFKEVSKELTDNGSAVPNNEIFSYPLFALFVVSGAATPDDQVPTRIQFRYPPGISELLPRGTFAAKEDRLIGVGENPPILIKESCENLKSISDKKDLNAYMYTAFSDIKLNVTTGVVSAFVRTDAFLDIERKETASGIVSVRDRSNSGGIGFNLGGWFSGSGASTDNRTEADDGRTRYVSANIVQNVAEQAVFSGDVLSWIEVADSFDRNAVVTMLMNFVLGQEQAVQAQIREEKGQWSIWIGQNLQRTLNEKEVDLLLKSAPTAELRSSGKEVLNCSLMGVGTDDVASDAIITGSADKGGDSQCSSERKAASRYANDITWQEKGDRWVPTSVSLYAFNQLNLQKKSVISLEEAIVTTQSEPQIHVLNHIVNTEPIDNVGTRLSNLDAAVAALNARLDSTDESKALVASADTHGNVGGPIDSEAKLYCPPGYVAIGFGFLSSEPKFSKDAQEADFRWPLTFRIRCAPK